MNDTTTSNSRGASAPDPAVGEVTYTRVWDAPRELVFQCMTEPEHLTHFWGPVGVSTPIDNIKVDLRAGGAFETTMVNDADGAEYPMRAVFVEVVPPEKLVFTETGDIGITSTITFTDLGDGTCQTVIHQSNIPEMYMSEEAQAGMQSSFDKLAAYLATLAK